MGGRESTCSGHAGISPPPTPASFLTGARSCREWTPLLSRWTMPTAFLTHSSLSERLSLRLKVAMLQTSMRHTNSVSNVLNATLNISMVPFSLSRYKESIYNSNLGLYSFVLLLMNYIYYRMLILKTKTTNTPNFTTNAIIWGRWFKTPKNVRLRSWLEQNADSGGSIALVVSRESNWLALRTRFALIIGSVSV